MKKRILVYLTAMLLFVAMLPMTVFATSASAKLTGPGTVRAGDTIKLSFVLNGSKLVGASGTLSYDSSQLTLKGTSKSIGGAWAVEFNGNNFVAYDNNLTSPINKSTTLFTVSFQVKNVSAGTKINVSYKSVKATDGGADANIGTVTYSATVAAPLSGENTLQSLTVSNATISPGFSPDVTSYTAQVPFEVSKLQVSASAKDAKAKVSVSSPNLTPNGTTKVTVKVTAENGSAKTYTISVKRAQDPNYVPSNNSKLSAITVDGFMLSPGFSQSVKQYVVWLPYEVKSVTISGTAEHSLGSVRVEGGSELIAGADNEVKVIGVAEDGSETVYTVIVKRGPAHEGQPEETQPTTEPEITEPETIPSEPENNNTEDSGADWNVLLAVLALVIGLVIGVVLDRFLMKKKK